MRMRRITMPSVAWPTVHISTLSHKRHDFRGGRGEGIERKMCVLIFSEISVWNILILGRIQRDIVMNVNWPSCKVPVIFCQILMKIELSRHISESPQISNFMKIHPVGAELSHTEGRKRPMTKVIVASGNFVTVPKNGIFIYILYRIMSVSKWLNKNESKFYFYSDPLRIFIHKLTYIVV
jgi:hypothetical protein